MTTASPPPSTPGPGQTTELVLDRPIDLRVLLGPLARGSGDPTMRVAASAAIRASMTPDGPGTIDIRVVAGSGASGTDARGASVAAGGATVRAEAWGPGAGHLLAGLPALLGLDDDDTGFDPGLHPAVASLAHRLGRVRLGRTGAVWEALLPAMLEQRITGTEAWRNYRRLVLGHGAPAPGPHGLRVAPGPEVVRVIPSWTLTSLGIEPRRGALLRRIAGEARRLEAMGNAARAPGGGGAGARALEAALRANVGIGPWTAAEVMLRALGDPDAVSVADAHLSNVVGFVLAGANRSTDERMLELLAPWAGHRARVVRLIERSGFGPPRFGPRVAPRDIVRDEARRGGTRR